MKLKFLLLALLITSTAKAITFEQQCYTADAGPTTSVTCNLTDVEPDRTFWIGVHSLPVPTPPLTITGFSFPACLTITGSPSKSVSTGNDNWYYTVMTTTGIACCTGTQPFTVNFRNDSTGLPIAVTNVQMFVYQIQGLGAHPTGTLATLYIGDCSSTTHGLGTQPSCTLINVIVGDFILSWVSTARGSGDNFAAGPSYTLLDRVGPDSTEWKESTTAGNVVVDFTGNAVTSWEILAGAFTSSVPSDRTSYCGAPPAAAIIHRRNVY